MKVIITSINKPNKNNLLMVDDIRIGGHSLILVGDKKTPSEWHMGGVEFLEYGDMKLKDFNYFDFAPVNHYARKNLGYLQAMLDHEDWIYETDDDNFNFDSPFVTRDLYLEGESFKSESTWLNIYTIFDSRVNPAYPIWPRGFDLKSINSTIQPDGLRSAQCPIQQGLANDDPDVDAIFRLLFKEKIKFMERKPVILGLDQWAPINSQSTWWHRSAFRLLYLPSTCKFRLTDIVRGYVALAVLKSENRTISFHSPVVYQERNEHDLFNDFSDEVTLYLRAREVQEKLSELIFGVEQDQSQRILKCYETLVDLGVVEEAEIASLKAWLSDFSD